jgi:hypothetical protein
LILVQQLLSTVSRCKLLEILLTLRLLNNS